MKTTEEASNDVRVNKGLFMSTPLQIADKAFKSGVAFTEQMIPVTEELPSEENGYVEENVLIQDKWGNIAVGVYTYGEYWDSQDERIFANDIVSWRPLKRK